MEIRFANRTLATASSIEATLEGTGDIFVIQQDAEYFDWEAGDTVALSPRFTISSAPFAIGDYTLALIMNGDCGTYTYHDTFDIDLTIDGTPSFTEPWLLPVGFRVHDSLGDSDGIIEPREAISIFVDVTNYGASSAPDVHAAVVVSPFFFPVDSAGYGDIDVFDTVGNVTAIVCSTASYTPSDTTLFVPIRLSSGGYSTTVVASIVIGDGSDIGEVASPLKPDEISIFAYPNPFNSAVSIILDYGSESAKPLSTSPPGACRVEIFDIAGRRVAPVTELVKVPGGANLPSTGSGSGIREFIWTPEKSLGSGVYLVRATIPERTASAACTKCIVHLK